MRVVRSAVLVGLLLVAAGNSHQDRMLTVSERDLRAAATQRVEPEYPAVARQIRLTGEVELEVLVDPSGAVEKANVLKGNTLLIGPSLQAIRKWKFKPFEGATGPARVTGSIKFNFQM